ncbi:hypothetical protein CC86DRAFT_376788 [Ophiobolus disseminans]|uniref:Uncharacterized protein n=1 Tax=Ophiobolus disseminans TaxID=1469910 RepID=A0A6A7AMC4_9PLEO|nr:hypothetical protein CC86DRAFT_376788 [Ophiobolus disseminans]
MPSQQPNDAQIGRDITTEVNSQVSGLLRLPAEVRNKIYKLACQGIVVYPKKLSFHSHTIRGPLFTILHICRQIRHEARLILYCTALFDVNIYDMKEALGRTRSPPYDVSKLS